MEPRRHSETGKRPTKFAGQITNMGKGKTNGSAINHLSTIAYVMFCQSSAVGPPRIHVI
jgi:hypothetical protein